MPSDLLVRMEGIDKSFPGVQALADARFELGPGEVHALVGENGAGKSTLMKVLSGIYRKDAGTIWYKGQEVDIPNPRAGLDLGISMIHQELVLAPHLTVAQNIFMGREPRGRAGFTVDDRRQVEQTAELIERLHLRLDPKAKVKDLKVAQQQMVSIAQALSVDASVLIMDEPTAALTNTEIGELFRIIRTLTSTRCGCRPHLPSPRGAAPDLRPRHGHARRAARGHGGNGRGLHRRHHLDDGRAHHLRGGPRDPRAG